MIKIIKYGKKRRVTCENCEALLEFEQEDLRFAHTGINELEGYIRCPSCGEAVTIKNLENYDL